MKYINLKKQNVLFISRSTQYGGTEKIIVQMCEILRPKVNQLIVCSAGEFNTDYLKSINVKHFGIPDIENKAPQIIVSVLKILSQIVKSENITIIHTHHRMAALYAKLLGYRYEFYSLATIHGVFEDKIYLTKYVYSNVHLIACGNIVKSYICDKYDIKEENVTVIHNAVEKSHIHNRKMFDTYRKQDKILVGNIGRLSAEKGQKYFLKAIPHILKRINNVHFFIVGDGPDKKELESIAQKENIEKNVTFMGYRDDIQDIIYNLDLVVLTSLTEGLPLTPIEAFAYSKPVVATNVGGTSEIVKDGENGLLVNCKDIKSISEKIIKILTDRELYKKCSENAYTDYIKKFSYEEFKNKIERYYEGLK